MSVKGRVTFALKQTHVLYCFILVLLLEPAYVSNISSLAIVWEVLKLMCCSGCVFLYFIDLIKNKNGTKIEYFILLYSGYLYVISALHHNYYNTDILALFVQLALMMITAYGIKRDAEGYIGVLNKVLLFYCIINFFTVLAFPNGIYVIGNYYDLDVRYWFLGNRNPLSRQMLFTVSIDLIESFLYKDKMKAKNIGIIIICLATVIIVGSVTAFIGMTFLLAVTFINKKKGYSKLINIFFVYIGAFIVSDLLIVQQVQYKFINLLSFFGRDVTLSGRNYVWSKSLAAIRDNLLWGYGYEYKSTVLQRIGASHTHNFYLWTLLCGGIVGLALFSIIIFTVSKHVMDKMIYRYNRIGFALISSFFVMGISESLTLMPLFLAIIFLVDFLSINDIREIHPGVRD